MAVSKRHSLQQSMVTRGVAQVDRLTKRLLQNISPGSVAVIHHDDLDELAASGLIQAEVKAVVNAGQTMSGKTPGHGPMLLLKSGIPIVEIEPIWFPMILNQKELMIYSDEIVVDDGLIIPCNPFTKEKWLYLNLSAKNLMHEQLREFIDNTLTYAQVEREVVLKPLQCPEMSTVLEGKHVLIVVRGREFKQDLAALRGYIRQKRPVLIGVDGGADALLEQGYIPDIIIGDMDSVSDSALHCGAELIVHAFRNGQAPGLERLRAMGLQAVTLASYGTSEDMALLLSYDNQCEQIVTVGLHSSMYDFLEKGRQGMGSTVLVRMKVGDKLTDAKGIGKLTELQGNYN
ncbi:thiamine pyrophosphokinase [Paenibacillus sp. LMG 31456]|uniref:Thiamine pyrophosphokinase n=1 Tax=Paenibacillus foliorum TaxID=2654974 RepID=A0A972H765_9BACL|nr:putative cytokinetic ring protein SteA [Paenibacillus foliorum]NOU97651.1 thiamine pyrophosphokinase [Paenibacillus foliorum]